MRLINKITCITIIITFTVMHVLCWDYTIDKLPATITCYPRLVSDTLVLGTLMNGDTEREGVERDHRINKTERTEHCGLFFSLRSRSRIRLLRFSVAALQ